MKIEHIFKSEPLKRSTSINEVKTQLAHKNLTYLLFLPSPSKVLLYLSTLSNSQSPRPQAKGHKALDIFVGFLTSQNTSSIIFYLFLGHLIVVSTLWYENKKKQNFEVPKLRNYTTVFSLESVHFHRKTQKIGKFPTIPKRCLTGIWAVDKIR